MHAAHKCVELRGGAHNHCSWQTRLLSLESYNKHCGNTKQTLQEHHTCNPRGVMYLVRGCGSGGGGDGAGEFLLIKKGEPSYGLIMEKGEEGRRGEGRRGRGGGGEEGEERKRGRRRREEGEKGKRGKGGGGKKEKAD